VRGAAVLLAAAIAVAPLTARADAPAASAGSAGASSSSSSSGSYGTAVPAKARSLADRGRALHERGDYANAIAAFTLAYAMAPSPALLFNLAQAYRLQGDCDDAALMYRRYLATNPTPEGRALAETHLANVERCVHKLALHIPVETASGRLAVPMPALEVGTSASSAPRTAAIEKDVGIGLAIGGGVALSLAAYYTVQAHDAADDVAAAYARGAKWKDVAATDARGKSAARTAKLFGAGGAIGVVGGIVTYLIGRHTERAPVTVVPTSRGAEVSMSWAF
jgi:tetratricopeptide (TPR) repeat protein